MIIDSWECKELYSEYEWRVRTAARGRVEWEADQDGLRVTESSLGYQGGTGSYGLPPNVAMWLAAVVR